MDGAKRFQRGDGEELRDATEVELMREPDLVLEAMANGELGVSRATALLADEVLRRRHGASAADVENGPSIHDGP
jgi:hypothetical protein